MISYTSSRTLPVFFSYKQSFSVKAQVVSQGAIAKFTLIYLQLIQAKPPMAPTYMCVCAFQLSTIYCEVKKAGRWSIIYAERRHLCLLESARSVLPVRSMYLPIANHAATTGSVREQKSKLEESCPQWVVENVFFSYWNASQEKQIRGQLLPVLAQTNLCQFESNFLIFGTDIGFYQFIHHFLVLIDCY